ncbi:MAG: competence/damage-inducible protein A [Bacteroidota bacterium]
MNATIITVGDELLNGQTVDTNAAWLGQELNGIGYDIVQRLTVRDQKDDIVHAIGLAFEKSDLAIMTGGLGPTKDDVTKTAIAAYFDDQMVFDEATYQRILDLFRRINRTPTELHREQCYMPASATMLENNRGTAPGMWIERDGKVLISMPGVPREMKGIMRDHGLRLLSNRSDTYVNHYIIRTAGVAESFLAEDIEDIVADFPDGLTIAYLPGLATVKLRLTVKGHDRERLEQQLQKYGNRVRDRVQRWVFAIGSQTLPEVIGTICKSKQLTIGTCESCTGGQVAHQLVSIPGSSAYYRGSIVSYSNELKQDLLHIDPEVIAKHGAVSEATVRAMTSGGLKTLGVDAVVAISGIAGPTGGTPEKPVGTVWIAVGNRSETIAKKYQLGKDREMNIDYASSIALNQLRLLLRSMTAR